ncbi:hypothetical protein LCI18_008012 [Fusarium solani-melongenae]|uniref:Uncharacterized protein n=1 Tax=Fusarium solani subsp. cucurbitae TaxID=2747967 RepID=A0ACD3Z7G3_FUSSC|nr:hypothetical protein LCI18_008012 [Fusarium solani-melongenae]
MDEDPDYYRILEINDSADEATIKRAIKANYKRLALKNHPDKNPGDKNATARFQKVTGLTAVQIQHAFDILSDDSKRKEYNEGRARRSGDTEAQKLRNRLHMRGLMLRRRRRKKDGIVLSSSGGSDSRNMTGNADNKRINVGARKNNSESNNNRERNKHGVNERNNGRETSNIARTSSADKKNNNATGRDMNPMREQKSNQILA